MRMSLFCVADKPAARSINEPFCSRSNSVSQQNKEGIFFFVLKPPTALTVSTVPLLVGFSFLFLFFFRHCLYILILGPHGPLAHAEMQGRFIGCSLADSTQYTFHMGLLCLGNNGKGETCHLCCCFAQN